MKNTRECGDAKAGNPSAAGIERPTIHRSESTVHL